MRLPTYFISHGGGPWPYMKNEVGAMYARLEQSLQDIARAVGPVKAVVVVTAHWENSDFTVQRTAKPAMIYDYFGFPPHTYSIQYPAPGDPQLADRVIALIGQAGLSVSVDSGRGFDHGTFVPLAVMYPQADVPVVQVSLKAGYDVTEHQRLGRALTSLRDEGVLILGSGLSYHNLRRFGGAGRVASAAFDQWLTAAVTAPDRDQRLQAWSQAPSAREAHPREDHLMPLMVAASAATGEPATRVYHESDFMGGISVSSFRFG